MSTVSVSHLILLILCSSVLIVLRHSTLLLDDCFTQSKQISKEYHQILMQKEVFSYLEVDDKVKFEVDFENLTDPHFLRYLSENWILSPSKLPPAFLEWSSNYDFSQVGQSKFVDKLLSQKQNGFYIECGAANGIAISNSIFFEVNRNWTGVLIEPDPTFFNNMIKMRRHAYMVNSCLSTERKTSKHNFIPDLLDGGLEDQSQAQKNKLSIIVQCFPLSVILLALGNPKVDYFSLDVEGPELAILQTINFMEVYIDVIGIEYRVLNQRKQTIPDDTKQKLTDLREFFNNTGLYTEVGILPDGLEINGLDVLFKRIT